MKDFFIENTMKFEDCIKSYITKVEGINDVEERYWQLIHSIRFANGKISPDCELFRCMKTYADNHPIDKIALTWQLSFEDIPQETMKVILLELLKNKEKNPEDMA